MKKIFAVLMMMFLASCSTPTVVGTGIISGKPVEITIKEKGDGLKLGGYALIIDGEELGVLAVETREMGFEQQIVEFTEINTRYGTFDAVSVSNFSLFSATETFKITLDGKYIGSISRDLTSSM